MGTVLGLDYGAERIGVAVSDAEERVAVARGVIGATPEDVAVKAVRKLAAEESAEYLVLGLPRTLAGGEGPQAAAVRAFGARVAAATRLPVDYVDERFTSADAERAAKISGQEPDAEAARLILETWLAWRRERG